MIRVYANIQRRGWQSLSRRKEDNDDTESIKASMLAYRRDTLVEDSPAAMQSDVAVRLSNPLPQSIRISSCPSRAPYYNSFRLTRSNSRTCSYCGPRTPEADFYSNSEKLGLNRFKLQGCRHRGSAVPVYLTSFLYWARRHKSHLCTRPRRLLETLLRQLSQS